MDSSVSETHGQQQGSAFNGHFGCTCYHPLFVSNQIGDLERVMPWRGNRHSARFWRRVLLPVIARYRELDLPKFFRGDAAFGSPKLTTVLEAEGYWYAIRLKANAVLERKITHMRKRPVARPPEKPKVFYHSFRYQAKSWDRSRRVVAKIEWHAGELFPRVGFVMTDLRRTPRRVIKFYYGRGTADQWIKEEKNAPKWTRRSCRRFKYTQALLQLFASAYNLANLLRQLALPRLVQTWSLAAPREKRIRNGAKVIRHAKAVTLPSRSRWRRWRYPGRCSRRSWAESVGCAPPEPRVIAARMRMRVASSRREWGWCAVTERPRGRGTSRRGRRGVRSGLRRTARTDFDGFSLDLEMQPSSNVRSGWPGEVPDTGFDPHPGNPG
jgi:hypothetical protein